MTRLQEIIERTRKRNWFCCETDSAGNLRWCHAGGVINFTAIGHVTDHPNYGFPCVTGYIAELDIMVTNCIFCGRENPHL